MGTTTFRHASRAGAALFATLLGVVPGTQIHAAAAVSTNAGVGPAVLQFTTPSPTIDCSTTYTFTGTAVMVVHGPAGDYSGPVTIQGTAERCTDMAAPNAQFTVSGSAEFGDFGCGTPASPMVGWWIPVVADLIVGVGTCHVAGATVAQSDVNFQAAPSVPTSLGTSWIDAGVMQWHAP